MGSPSVFHTAPPQPASKARLIWSPVFVGGAEASQKGLGEEMPAMFTRRSAMIQFPLARSSMASAAFLPPATALTTS